MAAIVSHPPPPDQSCLAEMPYCNPPEFPNAPSYAHKSSIGQSHYSLSTQLLIDQVREILNEHDRNPLDSARENAKQTDARNASATKRPHLTIIPPNSVPLTRGNLLGSPNCSSGSIDNRTLFPGLNTPDDRYLAAAGGSEPGELTVEKLMLIAKLLSPLRSRSSTGSSSNQMRCGRPPPHCCSTDCSQTLSYASSFGVGLQSIHSHSTNESDLLHHQHNSVPVLSYRPGPTPDPFPLAPLRAWGMPTSLSYFDIYKPVNVRYPSVWEFADIRSPVFRVTSSAIHTTFSMVWREIDIALAQEIWQWGKVFLQIRDRTLFKLSALSRNKDYLTSNSNQIWKSYRYNLQEVVAAMRQLYRKRYGRPSWATSDQDVLLFLNTCDTCVSSDRHPYPHHARHRRRPSTGAGSDGEKSIEVSLKFGSDTAQVRRFMRQIVVDPSHIYATAGEDFELPLSLWDPHQSFDQLKPCTTFELDPEIPWLHYHAGTQSFVGQVPIKPGSAKGLEQYLLELGIVARTVETLPREVERETTIKAKVGIWVLDEDCPGNTATATLFADTIAKEEAVAFHPSPPPGSVGGLSVESADGREPAEKGTGEESPTWQKYYEGVYPRDWDAVPRIVVTRPSRTGAAWQTWDLPDSITATAASGGADSCNPLYTHWNDSLSTLAGGEDYSENALDSWMANAREARRLQGRSESDGGGGAPFASILGARDEHEPWSLERTRLLSGIQTAANSSAEVAFGGVSRDSIVSATGLPMAPPSVDETDDEMGHVQPPSSQPQLPPPSVYASLPPSGLPVFPSSYADGVEYLWTAPYGGGSVGPGSIFTSSSRSSCCSGGGAGEAQSESGTP